jgi:hypothetical protein
MNSLDFRPGLTAATSLNKTDTCLIIERAIIEGSGGPDCIAISQEGLRFIRHLLAHYGNNLNGLPNFKNKNTIKHLAQTFIDHCGSLTLALENMQNIMLADNEVIVAYQ